MKRLWAILLAVLLTVSVTAPASAWEFELEGHWLWGYDYVDQAGRAGFFGPYDVSSFALAAPGGAKFNSMNAWLGARTINSIQYGMVTGSDGSLNWMRMEMWPEFRLNKAVRIRGAYQIGSGTNEYGLYANSTSFGSWNPMASGTWTQLWMTAQTPWGILVAGKRGFAWGMGLQYDGNSCQSEAIGVVAPYGPLRIGFVIYPWRGQTWVNSLGDRDVISSTTSAGAQVNPGAGFPAGQFVVFNTAQEAYRLWDNDRKRQLQPGLFITYEAGDVSTGIVWEWFTEHNGPAASPFNGNVAGGDFRSRTYDAVLEDGSAYFKYNNGRFFANMELAWVRGQITKQLALTEQLPDFADGLGSTFAPKYLEAWKWAVEVGAMSGPGKLSFLWSWVPGPDRRGGVWIDRQSWENVVNGDFINDAPVFLPYSLLMGYQYAAGLLNTNRNGEGGMTDCNAYGARMDYAVAANLNIYGTFFYADRASNGWPWGILTLASDGSNGGGRAVLFGQNQGPLTGGNTAVTGAGTILNAPQNRGPLFAPNIPDNSLGYEITAGADWKLLEGLTMRMRGAYWNVGKWFNYACVDKTLASTSVNTGTAAAPAIVVVPQAGDGAAIGSAWAVNPGRGIDPIWMFQGIMCVDF